MTTFARVIGSSLVALVAPLVLFACSSSPPLTGGTGGFAGGVGTGGRGGAMSSGGATSTGGVTSTGGAAAGGSAMGGAIGTGGANTGGATSAGGGGGGAHASGGSSTGGAASGGKGGGGGVVGSGGSAGHAGTVEPYRRCDQNLGSTGNPGCDTNARCMGGRCSFSCMDDLSLATGTGTECPPPFTGTATRACSILDCVLQCTDGKTCPDGMTCDATSHVCAWP